MTEEKVIGKVIEERHWSEDKMSCTVTRKAVMDNGDEYKIDTIMFGEAIPKEVAVESGISNTIESAQQRVKELLLKDVTKDIRYDVNRNDKWFGVKATLIVANKEYKS